MKDLLRSMVLVPALAAQIGPARAEVVPRLHWAERIVTGTEEPERTRGIAEALAEVVVKLTGDASLAGSARLAPLVARAPRLVARLEYEDRMKDLPVRGRAGNA